MAQERRIAVVTVTYAAYEEVRCCGRNDARERCGHFLASLPFAVQSLGILPKGQGPRAGNMVILCYKCRRRNELMPISQATNWPPEAA